MKVPIKFKVSTQVAGLMYNPGETAGFSPELADSLMRQGLADPVKRQAKRGTTKVVKPSAPKGGYETK